MHTVCRAAWLIAKLAHPRRPWHGCDRGACRPLGPDAVFYICMSVSAWRTIPVDMGRGAVGGFSCRNSFRAGMAGGKAAGCDQEWPVILLAGRVAEKVLTDAVPVVTAGARPVAVLLLADLTETARPVHGWPVHGVCGVDGLMVRASSPDRSYRVWGVSGPPAFPVKSAVPQTAHVPSGESHRSARSCTPALCFRG